MKKGLMLLMFSILLVACTNKTLNPPTNIRLTNNTITFDEVKGASYYQLELNGELMRLETNEYVLTKSSTYLVRIKTFGRNNNRSEFSELFTFYLNLENSDYKPFILDGSSKKYIESNDIIVNFAYTSDYYIKSITAPNNDIELTEYQIEGNRVSLSHEFLKRKFEEDRKELILAFVVSNDVNQHIINVFISDN